jgi:hypothetical protein
MFYRAIGFVVWKMALKYLQQRFGGYRRPLAALTVVAAIAAIYVATRNDE